MKWLDKLMKDLGYKAEPQGDAAIYQPVGVSDMPAVIVLTGEQEYAIWRIRRAKMRGGENTLSFN